MDYFDAQLDWETRRLNAISTGCLMLKGVVIADQTPSDQEEINRVIDLIDQASRLQGWQSLLLFRLGVEIGSA